MCFLIRKDFECWGENWKWGRRPHDVSNSLISRLYASEAPKTIWVAWNIRVTPFPHGVDASRITDSNIYKLGTPNCAPKTSTNELFASARLSVRVSSRNWEQIGQAELESSRKLFFCESIENFSVSGKLGRKSVFRINCVFKKTKKLEKLFSTSFVSGAAEFTRKNPESSKI